MESREWSSLPTILPPPTETANISLRNFPGAEKHKNYICSVSAPALLHVQSSAVTANCRVQTTKITVLFAVTPELQTYINKLKRNSVSTSVNICGSSAVSSA
jgi:hypothetical protein